MSLTVKKAENKKDLKAFIRFYNNLYKNNPYFPTPLEFDEQKTLTKGKNPALEFCEASYWIAFKDNKVVGRIAAIINSTEQKKAEQPIGRFGYFDFIDDEDVSEALMTTAVSWLKERGIKTVHGPFGFTDLDRQGMLIEGFDQMGTMATIYNHEYYKEHLDKLGFTKSTDWIEFIFNIYDEAPEKIRKISEFCQKRYKVRPLKVKSKGELKKYIPDLFRLINENYSELYGFTELNQDQIDYYGKNYFGFVVKELVSLIVNEEDELVAIGVTMPSFTKALQKAKGKLFPFGWYHMLRALKVNDTLDMYLVAVDPRYQDKGVAAVMIHQLYNSAAEFGIDYVETNIELEDNHDVQSMWKFFDAKQHKRRRCYIKPI